MSSRLTSGWKAYESIASRVLLRFLIRIAMLSVFAAFGAEGFVRTLSNLFVLTALYCVVAAIMRREEPLGPTLTHLDEAAAYAAGAVLASWIS
jgi:hypothetical protein